MDRITERLANIFGDFSIDIIAALVILTGGWLLALAVSVFLKKLLQRAKLDSLLTKWTGRSEANKINISGLISDFIYYILLVFSFIAFLRTLGMRIITEPLTLLLNQFTNFIPSLVGAISLFAAAWIVANTLKFIIQRTLTTTRIDESLEAQAGITDRRVRFSDTIANVIYWLVFLLFLPVILQTLHLDGVLEPVQAMLEKTLGFLPNAFGASVIFIFGWLIARIVKQIVTSLLISVGANKFGERIGIEQVIGTKDFSHLLGSVVYVSILVPVIVAGLNALQLEAISKPATNMLSVFLESLPSLFGAFVLLTITFIVGRIVGNLTTNILEAAGFNDSLLRFGLIGKPFADGEKNTPAKFTGTLVLIAIMLFASIEAAELLHFKKISDLLTQFVQFAGQVFLGLIIFAIGLYLADVTRRVIERSAGENKEILSQLARLAIIVLATAMGLREMGIAQDIVNLAFTLILGAIALAFALSVGLGARETAGREVESWIKRLRGKNP